MTTEHIDFENLSGYNWEKLLIENPNMAIECDKQNGWETLNNPRNPWGWFRILEKHPQFIDRAKKHLAAWASIIALFPDLAKEFHDWNGFRGFDWFAILKHQPQFSAYCDECDGWKLLTNGGYWYVLLAYQPQFSDKCDKYDGWRFIEWCDWDFLLDYQPQFKDKHAQYYSKDEEKYCQMHGIEWVEHLIENPVDIKICDRLNGWSTLGEEDWELLLQKIPYLAHKKNFCSE